MPIAEITKKDQVTMSVAFRRRLGTDMVGIEE